MHRYIHTCTHVYIYIYIQKSMQTTWIISSNLSIMCIYIHTHYTRVHLSFITCDLLLKWNCSSSQPGAFTRVFWRFPVPHGWFANVSPQLIHPKELFNCGGAS